MRRRATDLARVANPRSRDPESLARRIEQLELAVGRAQVTRAEFRELARLVAALDRRLARLEGDDRRMDREPRCRRGRTLREPRS